MLQPIPSSDIQARVWKEWWFNNARTKRNGDIIARILDWEDPIFPTSIVGHTLWNILMFLIDEGLVEWRVLDHASGNGVLWIIMICYDLMKEKKISEIFFNDICSVALEHSKIELNKNAPWLILPTHFTNGEELESAVWGRPLDFAVSNIFQDPNPDTWSNLQFKETERIYNLLDIQWRILVKWPDYAPDIEGHFKKYFRVERKWEWDCINRHAGGTAARVKYLLWVKETAWA